MIARLRVGLGYSIGRVLIRVGEFMERNQRYRIYSSILENHPAILVIRSFI